MVKIKKCKILASQALTATQHLEPTQSGFTTGPFKSEAILTLNGAKHHANSIKILPNSCRKLAVIKQKELGI